MLQGLLLLIAMLVPLLEYLVVRGDDTIQGRNVLTSWYVTANQAGRFVYQDGRAPTPLASTHFTGIERLDGGSGNDVYDLASLTVSLPAMALVGNEGSNSVLLPGIDGLEIFVGEADIGDGFSIENISSLVATGSDNILRTGNVDSGIWYWDINTPIDADDGPDVDLQVSGTVRLDAGAATTFQNFAQLIGASDTQDNFTINDATLDLQIDGGNPDSGTGPNDRITIAHTLNSIWNLDGGDETVDFMTSGVTPIRQSTATFSGFEFITGGSGNDTFNLDTSVAFVVGGLGTNELVVGSSNVVTDYTGGAASDTITLDFTATGDVNWTSSQAEVLGGLESGLITFTGVETYNGAGNTDLFTVTGTTVNTINGRGGDDTIVIEATATAVSRVDGGAGDDAITLNTSVATVVGGTAATATGNVLTIGNENVETSYTGGDTDNADTLTLDFARSGNGEVIWTTNEVDLDGDGIADVIFREVDTINGATSRDVFDVTQDIASIINLREGNDAITIQASATGVSEINGGEGDDAITLNASVATVSGGAAATATGNVLTIGNEGIETTYIGGAGSDTLTLDFARASGDVEWTTNQVDIDGDGISDLAFSLLDTINGAMSRDVFTITQTIATTINGRGGSDNFDLDFFTHR